jgi:putative transposase
MGIRSVAPGPHTSKPGKGSAHRIYPYLLKDLKIDYPNQVWCTDITYLPIAAGSMYLVAIMDWYSRYVISWKISNTLEADFCIEALETALEGAKPQIFNTDQGSQFTSKSFIETLLSHEIKPSMDSRGRYLDNIFIERLWRSLKYELIYLYEFREVRELQTRIKQWFDFYNTERPHTTLGKQTPFQAYHANRDEGAPSTHKAT